MGWSRFVTKSIEGWRARGHTGVKREGREQKGKRAGAGRGWLARRWFGGRRRTRKTRRRVYAGTGAKEDKTPLPATPTLWTRRRTAMECLHLHLSSSSSSSSSPPPPASALPPSSWSLYSPCPCVPPLPTSSTYSESIEPETRGVDAPSWNGTCCHHRCRGEISEQRESRAFCLDGNVGPQIFHREFRG